MGARLLSLACVASVWCVWDFRHGIGFCPDIHNVCIPWQLPANTVSLRFQPSHSMLLVGIDYEYTNLCVVSAYILARQPSQYVTDDDIYGPKLVGWPSQAALRAPNESRLPVYYITCSFVFIL